MPNLCVQIDLYHAQVVESDVAAREYRKWLPHIGHFQIAGVPDRGEPNIGELNYDYLFKLIDELKYGGWVGCEYRPAQSAAAGLGWLYKLIDGPGDAGLRRVQNAKRFEPEGSQRGKLRAAPRFPPETARSTLIMSRYAAVQ